MIVRTSSRLVNISAFAALLAASISLTGCMLTGTASDASSNTLSSFSGILHGGPNPVIGARVVMYTTTSGGYGVGNFLQEATQRGAAAHQDTDASGAFNFAGGVTCPSGQFAYIVSYGGNTGANAANPNSVLMTALGRCDDLYPTGTAYTGGNVWIDELTTIAAGYALGNFINVTGNAVSGYTVGIGAPPTNNAGQQPTGSSTASNTLLTGCVANAYYDTTKCITTSAAGLRHAFATAAFLVNTSTGAVNTTNGNGGVIPVQFMNTVANILQSCVNSPGGGTDATTGLPTTTTTVAGGTTHDGTNCGKLFAFTSYTNDGTQSGTLTAAGNTLDAIKNLAHRPTGNTNGTNSTNPNGPQGNTTANQYGPSVPTGNNPGPFYNSACASGSNLATNTGNTTTSQTCLFNLATGFGFYNLALSTAPPDYTLAITYPKNSVSAGANTTVCGSTTPTTLGMQYPVAVATTINDDIVVLNTESGTRVCYNLITMSNNGAVIGANAYDANTYFPLWVSTDSYEHAIVPLTAATAPGIRVYAAGTKAGGTETPSLATTIVNGSNGANALIAALDSFYTAVDSTGNIWVTAQNSTSDLGFAAVTQNHAAPSYVGANAGLAGTAATGKYYFASVDIDNNFLALSSGSASNSSVALVPAGNTGNLTTKGSPIGNTGSGTPGYGTFVADSNGNAWSLLNNYPSSISTPSTYTIAVNKTAYTQSTGTGLTAPTQPSLSPLGPYQYAAAATGPPAVYAIPTPVPFDGAIDGNNVIWFGDRNGSTTFTSYIRNYDTVNNYAMPNLYGCAMRNSTYTVCDYYTGNSTSGQVADFLGVNGLTPDAAGNLWVTSPYNGQLTEVIGIAAPTWPLFIHNGTSMKP
jgi:hypothetical protein